MFFFYDVLSFKPLVNMFFAKICFATHTFWGFGQFVFWRQRLESSRLLFGHGQNVFWAVTRFTLYVFLVHALRVLGLTRFCIHIYFLFFVTNVLVKYLHFWVFLKTFWTKYKFPLFLLKRFGQNTHFVFSGYFIFVKFLISCI